MINELKENPILYKEYKIINFIYTNEDEKKLILKWRNHDDVRKWMFNKAIISTNEHYNYMQSLQNRPDKLCFLVSTENEYLGIIEFNEVNLKQKSAYFGLNTNMSLKWLGAGTILQEICLYLSKNQLQIKTLMLDVFSNNKRAISLYKRFNFRTTKEYYIKYDKVLHMEKTV